MVSESKPHTRHHGRKGCDREFFATLSFCVITRVLITFGLVAGNHGTPFLLIDYWGFGPFETTILSANWHHMLDFWLEFEGFPRGEPFKLEWRAVVAL